MKISLREAYCRRRGCPESEFEQRFMAETLFPHARLLVRMVGAQVLHFETDLALVALCGELKTETEIEKELKDYSRNPVNQEFMRRVLKLRVSGRRFARLVERCGMAH